MRITLGRLRRLLREADEALSPEDEKRDQLISVYSDIYKEKNGIRPRWAYEKLAAMSMEELEAAVDQLASEPGIYDDDDYEPDPADPGYYPPMEGGVSSEEMMSLDPMEDLPSHAGMGQRHHTKTRLHGPNVNKK